LRCGIAATIRKFALVAAANSGGVLPTPPASIFPAWSASRIGGPELNVDHLMA
jgi:hypothetical protein